MNKFGQAFLVGFAALAMSFCSSSAIAQEQQEAEEPKYISGFTEEEWAVIKREYAIADEHPHRLSGKIVAMGGEGEDRWVAIDLGDDEFGNSYFLHSKHTLQEGVSDHSRTASFVVFVFYDNPAANNDIFRREILMTAKCINNLTSLWSSGYYDFSLDLWIRTNTAFDADGSVVDIKQSYDYMPDSAITRSQAYHAAIGCETAYVYPSLLQALLTGQNRQSQPSIYDSEPRRPSQLPSPYR